MRKNSCDVHKINIVGSIFIHLFLALLDINYGGDGNPVFKVNYRRLGGYGGVWTVFNQIDFIGIINLSVIPFVFIFSSGKEF